MYMCTRIERINLNQQKYNTDNIDIRSIFQSSNKNYQIEFLYSPFQDTPINIVNELQNDMNITIQNQNWFEQWLKRIAHQTTQKLNVYKIAIE